MRRALDLSHLCPPSKTAFSVGAVIVSGGFELAYGYSRETDPKVHAEESALSKLPWTDLSTATIYSTLEPCSHRASRPLSCTQLILRARLSRVVFAYREPSLFVEGEGAEQLAAAGVSVVELPHLANEVIEINSHLLL
jgi:pyrimidine deaminase RibD-like protein